MSDVGKGHKSDGDNQSQPNAQVNKRRSNILTRQKNEPIAGGLSAERERSHLQRWLVCRLYWLLQANVDDDRERENSRDD